MIISPIAIGFLVVMFTLLGIGWNKSCNFVKSRVPNQIVKLYFAYSVFRIMTVLLISGVYLMFISKSMEESKEFVAVEFAMYTLMMVLTFKKKH